MATQFGGGKIKRKLAVKMDLLGYDDPVNNKQKS